MRQNPFADLQVSALGMGNMRLPTLEERGPIDEQKAREIIEYAYHNGINYFDTAYRYHGGQSESFVGEVLSQFPRDTWYLASKLPGHMMNFENGKLGFQGYLSGEEVRSIADIFEEQLQKCRVEYFDFYLLHNLCETSFDFYVNEELGVVSYLLEQKKQGRIRHLGFSAHGRAETIAKFLDRYDCFEFCQIQLNYLDWTLQDAKAKYDLLTKRNIPVIVMEPVRGGALARLGGEPAALLRQTRPDETMAGWAFRFLQSLPNVLVTLSGMTTLEQLKENIELFSSPAPLTQAEQDLLLQKAVPAMGDFIPCTACRYCCEACPRELDIPKLINMYNEVSYSGFGTLNFTLNAMKEQELPAACIGCGACQKLCPQNINIPGAMEKFAEAIAKK